MTQAETETENTRSVTPEIIVRLTKQDMLAAFVAGKEHERECGDTNKDCWDFATWFKEYCNNME